MKLHPYGMIYTVLYIILCKLFLETFAKKRSVSIFYTTMLLGVLSVLEICVFGCFGGFFGFKGNFDYCYGNFCDDVRLWRKVLADFDFNAFISGSLFCDRLYFMDIFELCFCISRAGVFAVN